MPRRREPLSPLVVHRTARVGMRATRGQRPLVSYQALCGELAASGPGTFGELDSHGARPVLRRYSDAWFAAAKRRKDGDQRARFPRRRRALMPVRWYHGTFTLTGRRLRVPVAGVDLGIIHPYAVAGPGVAGIRAGDPRRAPDAPGRQ
jgi:hypothetical protein